MNLKNDRARRRFREIVIYFFLKGDKIEAYRTSEYR